MPAYKYNTAVNRPAIWEAVNYTPHQGQVPMHNSVARHKVWCCGRRFGKSLGAAMDVFPDLLMPDQEWWICGPTYVLGEREFRQLYFACNRFRMPDGRKLSAMPSFNAVYNVNSGDMRIELPWNTNIRVVSAERPRSLQGEGLAGVIMSEAAEHIERTWVQYVRPALSDKGGRSIWASTPKGFNFFYDYWLRGQDPDYPDWESWRFATWENSAVFSGRHDPEILDAEKEMSGMMFDQEYGAKFTAFEGLIYPEFDPVIHATPIMYQPQFRNFWGIDFGFSVPWVCLDIMVDPMDNVYVWREYQVKYLGTMQHADALKERENPVGWHLNAGFADPAGPGDVATLNQMIGSIWAERVEMEQGYEAVKSKLQPRPWPQDLNSIRQVIPHYQPHPKGLPKLFIDPSCKHLIRQMTALRSIEEPRGGKTDPKQGQVKKDDHGPDALRYALGCIFVLGYGTSLHDAYSNVQTKRSSFIAQDREFGAVTPTLVERPFTLGGQAPWR